jgi:5-oxoprolinase (ATP-hydrolysing)
LWDAGAWREGTAAERSSLAPGDRIDGPAVITEGGATTFVPTGFTAYLAGDGSIRLRARSW